MKMVNPIATGRLIINLGLDIMFHPHRYEKMRFDIEPEFTPPDNDTYLWPPIPTAENIVIHVRKNNRAK